ncbi:Hypothetical protein CAP_4301 [Chondromyces apiculatus DSM 436]|uniref:Uncharacterized protein n=1 Tax=Chondromyces apiculatus DSM 436 TaxID=1192034 RepID=A0A017T754_9BACT|nr:Hypothetical protein CAP_4301 [Chondromyces apiculatus DSM 436]
MTETEHAAKSRDPVDDDLPFGWCSGPDDLSEQAPPAIS